MENKNQKSHTRASGMTQISISLPEDLVEKIDRLAENDSRSRSNYIAYMLNRIPENDSASFLAASEPKKAFNS